MPSYIRNTSIEYLGAEKLSIIQQRLVNLKMASGLCRALVHKRGEPRCCKVVLVDIACLGHHELLGKPPRLPD